MVDVPQHLGLGVVRVEDGLREVGSCAAYRCRDFRDVDVGAN